LFGKCIDDAGAKPGFGLAKTPSGFPIPLSVIESFQSVPDAWSKKAMSGHRKHQ
jgi:hypothetical protein